MKRWLTHLTIVVYLTALLIGIACHAVSINLGSHPIGYYLVWDMFCGWSAYSERTHIVGEGVSGKYYELAPGPWGDFHPFGDIARHHYDSQQNHMRAMALNCLAQTKHEPMARVFVLQECWPKKFNMPEPVWRHCFDEPRPPRPSYFQLCSVMTADGDLLQHNGSWFAKQMSSIYGRDRRLQADSRMARPFYSIGFRNRADLPEPRDRPASAPSTAAAGSLLAN